LFQNKKKSLFLKVGPSSQRVLLLLLKELWKRKNEKRDQEQEQTRTEKNRRTRTRTRTKNKKNNEEKRD
jgi:hypothetical protein